MKILSITMTDITKDIGIFLGANRTIFPELCVGCVALDFTIEYWI